MNGNSGKSESKIPIHEVADNGKMPNKTDEVVLGCVSIHERGKASQAEKVTENTVPILGCKTLLKIESKGKGTDEM